MDEITFIYEENKDDLLKFEKIYYEILNITKKVLDIQIKLMFSVSFISISKSLELNNQYREKNHIGDVISFPIDDPVGIYDQLGFKEVGDIFITPQQAKKKIECTNITFFEEMAWLFTHGLLHILGFDHENNEEEAKQMFELTDKILKQINVVYKIV